MNRLICSALLGLAASASVAAVPPENGTFPRTTTKPTSQFAACFVQAQDRAARAWSFVPRENGGGTFSNAGAKGVSGAYFLKVADLGSRREIRLESASASADASVLRAVDACV